MTSTAATTNPANPAAPQFASLYVGDLDPQSTESVLYEVFNAVGPVASIRVCRDSVSRRSLGYAYVNFHNIQDAERALNTLNYTQIKGRACRIMWSQRDPALRRSGAGNVFVKNLDKTIDNKALYDTFSLFGNILSCKVATDYEGKSRGFGFVHFENDDSAKAAIEKLNNMQLGEKVVYVGEFQKNAERHADGTVKQFTNVYVKHIPDSIDEAKLTKMFEEFGTATSVVINTDNKGRRFAFVNYDDFDSAARAVEELHGKDFRTEEEKKAYEEAKKAEGEDEEEIIPEGDIPETQLYVQRAQSKIERQTMLKNRFHTKAGDKVATDVQGCNLYVKNLGETVDDAALKELFSSFGEVTSARVMLDQATGSSRGFGFVCFTTPDEATKAVTEMHLKLIDGKPLYVGLHEKKEQRMERLQNRYRQPQPGMQGVNFNRGFGAQGQMSNFNQGNPMYGARPNMPMSYGGQPPMGGPRAAMPNMMGGAAYPQGPRPGMPYAGANMMAPQMRGPAGMYGKGKGGAPMPAGSMVPAMGRPPMSAVAPRPGMGMTMGGRPQGMGYDPSAPLTAAALAAAPPGVQKQMLGEKLFPMISRITPEMAGKITGMMLEMDNSELLILLESEQQLKTKIDEAVAVLENK